VDVVQELLVRTMGMLVPALAHNRKRHVHNVEELLREKSTMVRLSGLCGMVTVLTFLRRHYSLVTGVS
jgi:hypothetical protein